MDTSAVIAILFGEPEATRFVVAIKGASRPRLSAASYVEASLRLGGEADSGALDSLDAMLDRLGIGVEPVTLEQAQAARRAGAIYGRGHHPAGLNFGDCFSYALAKVSGEALLFKGQDFLQTDIGIALPL